MTSSASASLTVPVPVSEAERGDLAACDREPIHMPGSIQPHGILLIMDENLVLLQASANAGLAGGESLEAIFGDVQAAELRGDLERSSINITPLLLRQVSFRESWWDVIVHRHNGLTLFDLEHNPHPGGNRFNLYPVLHNFVADLEKSPDIAGLCQIAARCVRSLTGYGRALVYRFDEDWHGEVIAEDIGDPVMPSLIGHHFPASDIPAQARELYRLNRMRIIPSAQYMPVPLVPALNPVTGRPADLSFSVLRSVSPVHAEYLKNMNTLSSMSVSIVVGGKLWGLIACHHPQPLMVSFEMRTTCEFVGQFLAPHIAARESIAEFDHRLRLKGMNSRLLTLMTERGNYIEALLQHQDDFLGLMGADGAAIVIQDRVTRVGATPGEDQIRDIIRFLGENGEHDLYHSESMAALIPDAASYKDTASGVMAVSISKLHQSYILWFRPEVLRTVKWSGDPRKTPSGDGRIHPRKSFETWKEIVNLKSLRWKQSEIDAAIEFRNSIVGIVLKRAEELADLNEELALSNQELEAFSYTVSHDLRAPFRHIVGYSELLRDLVADQLPGKGRHYLDSIIESGRFAGELVDNLLQFSKMGRLPLELTRIDMDALVRQGIAEVTGAEARPIDWRISALPSISGDPVLMKLVIVNLLSNAVKYTRHQEKPVIEIRYARSETEHVFAVSDNGVGFDMQYIDKLFGVFQRLHKMEDFEGTGIGLANVKRIITRHGGRVWAHGEVGRGATFTFTLPLRNEDH